MQRTTTYHLKLRTIVTTLLLAFLSCWPLSAGAFEFLNCNGDTVSFDSDLLTWSVQDHKGNGIVWKECSAAENVTGGSGKALCVDPQGVDYDTTVTTSSFNLKGATSATMKLIFYYQDAQLFKDRVHIEAKESGGVWNTVFAEEINDWGLPGGPGIEISLNLNLYLGSEEVKVRFRYHDQSNAGIGDIVQIDDVRLECTGGADLEVEVTQSATTVIEGEDVRFDFLYTNHGPQSATDLIGFAYFADSSSILELQGIPFGSMENVSVSMFAFGPPVPLASGSVIDTVQTRVRMGIFPEIALQVKAPAAISGSYDSVGATFGPALEPGSPLTGTIALAVDGMGGSINDGCDPLTNPEVVNGKIVLLHNVLCDADTAVKNAQDAGAVAAIVDRDNATPTNAFLYPGAALPPLTPSGSVVEPITIPSFRVSSASSSILKLNIASEIEVEIQGVDVLAQEQGMFGFTFAEEFDPDFSFFEILLGSTEESTNLVSRTVTVLRDRDSDGTADIDDGCRSDAAKTAPGACGCGVPDSDSNGDSIIDCLELPADPAESVRISAAQLFDALAKLKALKPNLKKTKRKKVVSQKKLVQQYLNELLALIEVNGAAIVLSDPATNLDELALSAKRKVRKALKLKSRNFKKNKKRAKKVVNDSECS